MAKKRGTPAAKSKVTTTNGNKKKSFSKSTNNTLVSVSSVLQNFQKSHAHAVVETLVPGHVFYCRNFLSKQTCQALIQMAESSGDMEYVAHAATRHIAQRECGRWQQTDKDAARLLFLRMRNILTQMKLEDSFPSDYRPVACNSNLRLYKYEKKMSFGKHYDGSNTVEEGETEITVLVYLSDCVGGATRFYPPQTKSSVAFEPEEGAILLHIHGDRCLQHEADPVVSGLKYVLRTDVVYAKQP